AHKIPLEMYAYLLQWFVSVADKVRQNDQGPSTPAPKSRRGRGGKSAASSRAKKAQQQQQDWSWADSIPSTFVLISKVLRLQTQRIWTTTAERDTFVSCLTRPAYTVLESETYMKQDEIKTAVYKVICYAVKHSGHGPNAQIAIVQNLQFFEHLAEPMAQLLHILINEFNYPQLADEVLRQVALMTFGGGAAADTKGPRTFSRFLIKFAEASPRHAFKQIALLLNQLDSEAYPIRIAVVEILAFIIQDLSAENEAEGSTQTSDQKKQINGLYDLLFERTLDLSSYVRVRVFAVMVRLCDIRGTRPKQRLAMTQAAVSALEDKVASVRKSGAALLVQLALTHPWTRYASELDIEKWEAGYQKSKAELTELEAKVGDGVAVREVEGDLDADETAMAVDNEGAGDTEPEDNGGNSDDAMSVDGEDRPTPKKKRPKLKPRKSQMTVDMTSEKAALEHLQTLQLIEKRLDKRYHAEGLVFIRCLGDAVERIEVLLGSKNRAEVLEAIEFLRIAHEFKVQGADRGIKKMLHLVWSKDPTSSAAGTAAEDGGTTELKGVRQRLLECYRQLYFEATPGLEPKAQVSRIAKNMIELTYNATLAELTSLEELLRIMMEDDQIHSDVIAKLWAVYSKMQNLPSDQRRGAIVILGMLGLARRSVLTSHVHDMLRIGLSTYGKTDLKLARYTCVALQRLNGSAKKIKGSLLDKTIRRPMDDPIFASLKAAIERPTRSKEWFGLAEQAINTVYALGDHPDELCNDLIKQLTARAFAPKLGAADQPREGEPMDEDAKPEDGIQMAEGISHSPSATPKPISDNMGDAFELSQLLFVVGHVAIKHIVWLELVEREWKRQKDEREGAEKHAKSKEREELDQVAGNAEDEIGERISAVRESELLYGPESLLALYGPLLVHITGSPHKYKVRSKCLVMTGPADSGVRTRL
ncbi:unnamed protein product, partial [Mycena citricolor]